MPAAIIEAQYLPPIAYFTSLLAYDQVVVEKYEYFEKQTYRNRCYVNTVQGTEALIIPLTAKSSKTRVCDVRIDYSQKWLNHHWRTIQSAYGKAPFYEYYSDDLNRVLYKRNEFLYDLNLELLTLCLAWLRWPLPVRESLAYERSPEGIIDLRSAINPKKKDQLARFYKPASYHQVFGNKFVENLSLIDLVFCEGPGAGAAVRASAPK